MTADPELRESLRRAAADVRIDPEQRLQAVYHSVPRRQSARRRATLALAVAVGLAAVVVAWQLRPVVDRGRVPAADTTPTGRIAYMSLTRPLTGEDTSDLFVLDAASGEVASLYEHPGSFSVVPQWSPDGSKVAFASNDAVPGARSLFVAEADGSHSIDIFRGQPMDERGPVSLSWSPDGSSLAYVGRTIHRPKIGLWIVSADGSGRRPVLAGHWESVSWSPDGSRLLIAGIPQTDQRTGTFDIYTVRTDGSELTRISEDEAVERSPSWSPDGSRIVFAEVTGALDTADYGQDIFVMDADGSDVRRLTEWEGFDSFPVWSADGTWIAFASDRDATSEQKRANRSGGALAGVSIYAMRSDATGARLLLDGANVALLPSSWTP